MREITGAMIGITLVLTAVFIPMAGQRLGGRDLPPVLVAMAVSILFSAFWR
jgi:multidrug efflux pump subunit AcrB